MCLGGGARLHANASYGQMGVRLGQMGLQSLSPCYLGKITECGTSEHRGLDPKRLILTVGHGLWSGLVELDLRNSSRTV